MPRTLAEWLDYQQRVHKVDIDMGLTRIREVWQRLGAPRAPLAITVGGTNGKGSTVAFLVAMLRAMGQRAGSYISPHISVYNERICVDGSEADDATLCASFERIEQARGEIPLTYYEFATLAALDIFARGGVDVIVLEVGLGGRLDATNIIDADAVAVTTVDLDHVQWLGTDRDSIGREKAGIARRGRPAVVGDVEPPRGLLDALARRGAEVVRAGRDFRVETHVGKSTWKHRDGHVFDMPRLTLSAPCQQSNAATAVAILHALGDRLPWSPQAMAEGLRNTHLRGRLQNLGHAPEQVVDVAHNPQAARVLARWLDADANRVPGKVHAVYGALDDKDVAGVLDALGLRIDCWHLGGLEKITPRGLPAAEVARRLSATLPQSDHEVHAGITDAWQVALGQAGPDDAIVGFGSFFVVSAILAISDG